MTDETTKIAETVTTEVAETAAETAEPETAEKLETRIGLTEDFTDRERFAGEQNIAHIINVALLYPLARRDMM